MKISASIYSSREKDLEVLIPELDACRVDYFHIDCNDNPAVFEDIRRIRAISSTPVDLHLISRQPERYYEKISELNIELLTLQYEELPSPASVPEGLAPATGIAITSGTPVEVFGKFENVCSFILFMATTPGMSGGTFRQENFRKIREFRSSFPGKKIHVDGGINNELSFILRNMGVYASVIGSFLFSGSFIGSAMLQLRSDDVNSGFCIRDFMLQYDEIPVIDAGKMTFEDVLLTIDRYRMGFTNVAGPDGRLMGIISNADIRKGLLRNLGKLDSIDPAGLINTRPAFVHEDDTVSDLLAYIKNLSFPVLFLPVVNSRGQITGTIKFNNLIKGES